MDDASGSRRGLLDAIERIGNALPDPVALFALGTLLVVVLSHIASGAGWEVTKSVSREVRAPVLDAAGGPVVDPATGKPVDVAVLDPQSGLVRREIVAEPVRATSLLDAAGLHWLLSSMVTNFVSFPPLGIVLVGMLGIGLADRSGFLGALLRSTLLAVPPRLLTPAVVLVGVCSSIALDAGYVVLPPLAAALYHAVGRPPLAGLAAVFAGVAGGFSANLTVTSLDAILAGFSEAGARILDPGYRVAVTANLHFMIASTLLLTGVGWAVTALWVEPRLAAAPVEPPEPRAASAATGDVAPDEGPERLGARERRALRRGLVALALLVGLFIAAAWIPGWPLHGQDGRMPRWVSAAVPLLFLAFLVPGLVYGAAAGTLRSHRDAARCLGEVMAGMGPYVVLAFFAAQFVESFRRSGLGEMLALAGGDLLARAALPAPLLLVGFVLVVAAANLLIGSMSAKYAFLAPIFVPLFMRVGVSPELTQAAYRVGDSVTNIVTPLNPYFVVILVAVQRWAPRAGLGTVIALMLPYSVAFLVAWSLLLAAWIALGLDLGPAGPLRWGG